MFGIITETRDAVLQAFEKFSTRIRSILFSPKYPEIVMVFKVSAGKNDTELILDDGVISVWLN